jgi:hypothetical protein
VGYFLSPRPLAKSVDLIGAVVAIYEGIDPVLAIELAA